LLRSDYIPTEISHRQQKRTLNAAIGRAGFGRVFDIKKVVGKGANWYVTKYVSKCTASLPRYTRRLQTNVPEMRQRQGGWHFMAQGGYAGPSAEMLRAMLTASSQSVLARVADVVGVPGGGVSLAGMGARPSCEFEAPSQYSLNLISRMKKCATAGRLPGDGGASDESIVDKRAGPPMEGWLPGAEPAAPSRVWATVDAPTSNLDAVGAEPRRRASY